MVWRSLLDIAFSDVKQLLVGCREQLGENDSEFDSEVLHSFKTVKWNKKSVAVLKCKKNFFLRKLTEMPNLIFCFSEIPKIFICFRVRQVAYLSEDWTKVVRLKKCPLYGFRFSIISPWLDKCVKGKHIENRLDQTCLSFSTRSRRYSMTDLCSFYYTLSHDYLSPNT